MNLWTRIVDVFRLRPAQPRVHVSQRQAGVLVTEDTAMTLPEWWACVSLISRTVAALPWGVYERTPAGRKPVEGTVSWLLNVQPNPEMSAMSLKEALVAHALNWGNGYAEIQKDLSGRPIALWLLTPDRVRQDRNEAGELIYRVFNEGAEESILTADQVYHLHGLGFDGMSGYSLVRIAARSIGIGIAQDVFAQSFYANGTVMGTVIEMGVGMTAPQMSDLENYYNEGHRGPAKAFKTKVAPPGTKVHPLGMPLTDAQFIESRNLSVTVAARLLGIPPHKIADLARSTNNNIEHQGIEFVVDAILPWATRLEQEANIKLFGARAQGRVYTKMSLSALMRGDSAARAEFYRVMLSLGIMSVNEVRALEELNGIGPAGDAHLVQLNQTTLEWLVANPGAKAATPAASPAPEPSKPPSPATNVIRAEALAWQREQKRTQA